MVKMLFIIKTTIKRPIILYSLFVACTVKPTSEISESSIRYNKQVVEIEMRDGIKLNTEIYVPPNTDEKLPILFTRTPYGLRHDENGLHSSLSSSYLELAKEGYIFVFQDIRGRYGSEGKFSMLRTPVSADENAQVDEATDTYDTIDWLIENLDGHNRKVGILGISYGGWLTAIALTDIHPAVKAISPQASPSDMFMGDDFYHNGAFRLAPSFGYAAMMERSKENFPFDFGDEDVYDFYLNLGPLSNANKQHFAGAVPTWNDFMSHSSYDQFWKEKEVTHYLSNSHVPALNVAGWWDAEDFYGPMEIYHALEQNDETNINRLVVGPWRHGGWARGKGDSLGSIGFGSNTSVYYRESIQAPWFLHHLKGEKTQPFPEAHVFVTGLNEWKSYDNWPPLENTNPTKLFLLSDGSISNQLQMNSKASDHRTFISDPANPVPYTQRPIKGFWQGASALWKVEDQRFLNGREDYLSWQSEPLEENMEIAGDIVVNLAVSTTGSDADWIVKLIDVYPEGSPNPNMANYELMIADEVLRSKFRDNFSEPSPLIPNEVTKLKFSLGSRAHRFNKGHRLMVIIQSSWFPLIDRNPQKFIDIPMATDNDYLVATQSVFSSGPNATFIELPVIQHNK